MKKILISVLAVLLAIQMVGCASEPTISEITTDNGNGNTSTNTGSNTNPNSEEGTLPIVNPGDELNEQQKNSIAMLNYLAMLSQEINSSKNSRLFMEEAYASIINNIKPDKINEGTEARLSSLLDIIERYRMINVKRERLQYLYEKNQAKAIRSAIPNPVGLLSLTTSQDPIKLITSVAYMAIDAYSSYTTYTDELQEQYLQDGWELDDEEAENLHESRKATFLYMIEMVRDESLPGYFALNESSVDSFVKWKNNTNVEQRLQFLESDSAVKTYGYFSNYWLELSTSYYEHGDYKKCIEAFKKYENIEPDIFRKDYYLARAIPNVIASGKETMSDNEFVTFASDQLKKLIDNTEDEEWALKYYAAMIYIDIYRISQNKDYINKAYEITLNNINHLKEQQTKLNNEYLADVVEVKPGDNALKAEKNSIKDYNKSLKEKRKTEFPPIYEPLTLNLELLFSLADVIEISDQEKNRIENILHKEGALFLIDAVNNRFTFNPTSKHYNAEYDKDEFSVPVSAVNSDAYLKVTVTNDGETSTYTDWAISSVKRDGKTVSDFTAVYSSSDAKKQSWSENSTVRVEVFENKNSSEPYETFNFKVSKYKKRIWPLSNIVEFEQTN